MTTSDVRDRALLAALADAGDDGLTALQLHQATAQLWKDRTQIHVHLRKMMLERKIYQERSRGPYQLPIASAAR